MTSFSGFSSRKIQEKYNNLIKQLISTLGQIVIIFVQSSKLTAFRAYYQKISKQLFKLDHQKYSQPKFSKIIEPLNQHILFSDFIKQSLSQPPKKTQYLNNNFVRTKLLQNRKTISVSNPKQHKAQKKIYRSRQTSFGSIGSRKQYANQKFKLQASGENLNELSMQELMMKNPLIERKMSGYKKRRYLKVDFPQIREEEQDDYFIREVSEQHQQYSN